jgi:hypothetical protein
MPKMPIKLKVLFAIWIVLALFNLLAFKPFESLITVGVLFGMWRGGEGSQWYLKLSAFFMVGMGALILFTSVSGADGSTEAIVVLSIVGLLTIVPGVYTLWALNTIDVQEALNQRYIARLEAKMGLEE